MRGRLGALNIGSPYLGNRFIIPWKSVVYVLGIEIQCLEDQSLCCENGNFYTLEIGPPCPGNQVSIIEPSESGLHVLDVASMGLEKQGFMAFRLGCLSLGGLTFVP